MTEMLLIRWWDQAGQFAVMTGVGIVMALAFHFHQANVRQFPISGTWLRVLDLMVWVAAIPMVFWVLLRINQGELRGYHLWALAAGGVIYYFWLAPRFRRIIYPVSGQLGRVVRRVNNIISIPRQIINDRRRNRYPMAQGDEDDGQQPEVSGA